LPPGYGSWTYVTPPVGSLTINHWSNNNPYAVFTFVGTQPINSSVWLYNSFDVTRIANNGYVKATSGSQAIGRGVGARIFFRSNPFYSSGGVTSATGTPLLGEFTWTLNYCATGCAYPPSQGGTIYNGWNLIGNPYMGPIDWDDAEWTRSNVGPSTWIWRDRLQVFATYLGNVGGVNGGNNVIAHHQGFFVEATANPSTLKVTPSAVASAATQAAPSFFRGGNAVTRMRLLLSAGTWTDEVLLVNNPAASRLYFSREDSRKMSNPNLNLSFIGKTPPTSVSINLAISSYPLANRDTIPLSIKIASGGYLTLAMTTCTITGKDMFLWDRHTGAFYPFGVGQSLVVSNDTTDTRYALLIKNTSTSLSANAALANFTLFPNPATGSFTVSIPESMNEAKLKLVNLLGATVLEEKVTQTTQVINIPNVTPGVYFVEIVGIGRRKLVIE
jgi:hypothetical protein